MDTASVEDRIHRVISRTLLAGRLAPGTQLVETRLAAIFGVSRERIRKVLQRLGFEFERMVRLPGYTRDSCLYGPAERA